MWVNNINSFILDEQLTNREINTRKLRCNTYQMDSHWTIKHKYQSMKNKGNITPILNDTYIPANIINKKGKKNAPCGDVHTLYFYIPTTWRNFWWLYHSILKIINIFSHILHGYFTGPSYLHNGISYISKMTSLYWTRAMVSSMSHQLAHVLRRQNVTQENARLQMIHGLGKIICCAFAFLWWRSFQLTCIHQRVLIYKCLHGFVLH